MVELLGDDFWGGRPNDFVCGVCSPGYPFPTAPPVDPFARIKVVDCGVTKGCIRSVCVYVFCLLASMCVCQGVSLCTVVPLWQIWVHITLKRLHFLIVCVGMGSQGVMQRLVTIS